MQIRDVVQQKILTVKNVVELSQPGLLATALNEFLENATENSQSIAYQPSQLQFESLAEAEREDLLNELSREISQGNFKRSGQHRLEDWERGWRENLDLMRGEAGDKVEVALTPKYFRKYDYERLGGQHVRVTSGEGIERKLLALVVDAVTDHLVRTLTIDQIWEFGCGTGHHLLRLRGRFPAMTLVGLDWAESSQKILSEASRRLLDFNLLAFQFDYFNPDLEVRPTVDSRALFLTVASLEQIGSSHSEFLSYLLKVRPTVVIHFEPVEELLGESKEEQLSKLYFTKRNYLSGYLTALKQLRDAGRIELLSAERTGLGSYFIEGYSLIVWRPI